MGKGTNTTFFRRTIGPPQDPFTSDLLRALEIEKDPGIMRDVVDAYIAFFTEDWDEKETDPETGI